MAVVVSGVRSVAAAGNCHGVHGAIGDGSGAPYLGVMLALALYFVWALHQEVLGRGLLFVFCACVCQATRAV